MYRRVVKIVFKDKIGEDNANKLLQELDKKGDDSMSLAVVEMLNSREINARKEGRKEGKMQQLKEIAQKMLTEKLPVKTIIKITGMSKEEIEKLKQYKFNKDINKI